MEIGLALDRTLGLSFDDHRVLAREAAALNFISLWTNAGHEQDPFQVCATWWEASAEVVPGGLTTGISVIPVPLWTPYVLAAARVQGDRQRPRQAGRISTQPEPRGLEAPSLAMS